MYLDLSSFPSRQPSLARARVRSVVTSVIVHGAVVGALWLIGGPVWEATSGARTITRLTAPPRQATLPMARLKPVRRRTSLLANLTPALAEPLPRLTEAPLPTRIPVSVARPVMRIEAPPEVALVVAMPTLPAAVMPLLTAKSMVQVGLLDSAAGSSSPVRRIVAGSLGFDTKAPGASESARRLTSAGFDGGGPPDPTASKSGATLSNAGFDQADAPVARATAAKVVSAPFEGIEILEKPRPVYTEEARRLRIEGTVQLRVVFGAAGQIRVVSVVKGLGYGLDEAAVQAAVAIRFRPARRDGRPVDAPAVIQIQFQIA